MNNIMRKICYGLAGVVLLSAVGNSQSFAATPTFERNGRVEILDDRYHHGHYYVPRGVVVRELPVGYRPYWFHGAHFYVHGGVWYAPAPHGFMVVRPPAGLVVAALPPFYTTVWIGGTPYYYANEVYYRWAPALNGYEVVDAPAAAVQASEVAPKIAADDFFLYPKNGQTAEQESVDRYECHAWSKTQTGFDPSQPSAASVQTTDKPEQYRRAVMACLEARGYSVR